jgi:hypothetical protein
LQDANLIDESNVSRIVDRNKVRRYRAKIRKTANQTEMIDVKSLYFDGRKDRTMAYNDGRRTTIVEEHIVVISEPGSQYLTHLSPKSGSAKAIVEEIMHYLEINPHIVIENLCAIGCDGTAVNTGIVTLILDFKCMYLYICFHLLFRTKWRCN